MAHDKASVITTDEVDEVDETLAYLMTALLEQGFDAGWNSGTGYYIRLDSPELRLTPETYARLMKAVGRG